MLNTTEKEVIKKYKNDYYWEMVGRPIFKTLKCLQDYQPNPNEENKIFEKGRVYGIWICEIKDKKHGYHRHYVAIPQVANQENKADDYRMVIPQEIFGLQSDRRENVAINIEGTKYRLVLNYGGYFELIPTWHFKKDVVEEYVRISDKENNIFADKYVLYARVVGKNMNKAFPAYEVVRYAYGKRLFTTYFNTMIGKEVRVSDYDETFISLVGKPKPPVINNVVASYSYEKKRIILDFRK